MKILPKKWDKKDTVKFSTPSACGLWRYKD